MSPQLKTFLLAMTPLNELRGTIPLALKVWHLGFLQTFFWAVLGNIVPIFFLLIFWKFLVEVIFERFPKTKKLFNWIFERTRKKFYKKYSLYGDLALVLFVAIPLPFTGAWTGSIAAYLFGIKYWKAIGLIFLGIIISGLIVSATSIGIFSFL